MSTMMVVTFAWSLAFALLVLHHLFFRCAHDWEPLVERELPAVADVLGRGEVSRWPSIPLTYKAGRKKFFAIIGCKKCGATKEFSTLSGDAP